MFGFVGLSALWWGGSQFEALLIANDLLGAQLDLTLINVFAIFSTVTGSADGTTTTRTHNWAGSQESNSRPNSAATSDNSATADEQDTKTTSPFKWPWGRKSNSPIRKKNQQDGVKQYTRLQNHGTLDFSAFVEALDTMGYQLPEGELLTAFKAYVQEREQQVIDYSEFKELFMQVCDVERELIQLGFEEEARRTESVAKTLLHRLIEENEKVRDVGCSLSRYPITTRPPPVLQSYIQELAEAPARVARLRHLIRQNRDARRRQRTEYFERRARQVVLSTKGDVAYISRSSLPVPSSLHSFSNSEILLIVAGVPTVLSAVPSRKLIGRQSRTKRSGLPTGCNRSSAGSSASKIVSSERN